MNEFVLFIVFQAVLYYVFIAHVHIMMMKMWAGIIWVVPIVSWKFEKSTEITIISSIVIIFDLNLNTLKVFLYVFVLSCLHSDISCV